MKKQTLYLIIAAAVMLIVSVVLSMAINTAVLQEPKDLLFDQKIELKNQVNIEDPSGSSYSIIDYKAYGVDADGKTVGMVYTVKIKNGFSDSRTDLDYGYIELLVGFMDDKMYVEIVSLEQTQTYVSKIQAYIYENYQGVTYEEVQGVRTFNAAPDEDIESGASATTSTNAIKELLVRTFQEELGIVLDPYLDIFGDDYEFVTDDDFVGDAVVTEKQDVLDASDAVVATRYLATGSNEHGDVTIAVTINDQGEILYAEYTLLDQTAGQNTSKANIKLYIGSNLSDLQASGDITGGATHTYDTTMALFDSIADMWEGAQD